MTDTPIVINDPRLPANGTAPAPPQASPFAGAPPVPETTLLDDLAADINAEVNLPPVVYPVPHRPAYQLVCDVNIPYEHVQQWNRVSVDGRGRADDLQMSKTVIVAKCTKILRAGFPVTLEGRPLTFTSPELWSKLGVISATAAVKKLIGIDGDIGAIGEAILRDAGFGRSVEGQTERPDPTLGWSNG
jgi:hypothetical protein